MRGGGRARESEQASERKREGESERETERERKRVIERDRERRGGRGSFVSIDARLESNDEAEGGGRACTQSSSASWAACLSWARRALATRGANPVGESLSDLRARESECEKKREIVCMCVYLCVCERERKTDRE